MSPETPRCPGSDMARWKPEDIRNVNCLQCGEEIEIWKDEPFRICGSCGSRVANPRLDLGCAKWCPSADVCLGGDPPQHPAPPDAASG